MVFLQLRKNKIKNGIEIESEPWGSYAVSFAHNLFAHLIHRMGLERFGSLFSTLFLRLSLSLFSPFVLAAVTKISNGNRSRPTQFMYLVKVKCWLEAFKKSVFVECNKLINEHIFGTFSQLQDFWAAESIHRQTVNEHIYPYLFLFLVCSFETRIVFVFSIAWCNSRQIHRKLVAPLVTHGAHFSTIQIKIKQQKTHAIVWKLESKTLHHLMYKYERKTLTQKKNSLIWKQKTLLITSLNLWPK